MGTVTIKNLSTIEDRYAARLAIDYWIDQSEVEEAMQELKVDVQKKGHTFTVVDTD